MIKQKFDEHSRSIPEQIDDRLTSTDWLVVTFSDIKCCWELKTFNTASVHIYTIVYIVISYSDWKSLMPPVIC